MAVAWKDPDYHSDQNAFYYVRALQNPTCRWSTYDALRLGQTPPAHVPCDHSGAGVVLADMD